MSESSPAEVPRGRWIPRNTLFFVALIALLMISFALLRAGLLLRNRDSAQQATTGQILLSFLVGLRFDLSAACYFVLPAVIIGHLPWVGLTHSKRLRRILFIVLTIVFAATTFTLLAEYEFFREFQTRFNQLVFQYMSQPRTVAGMIWYSYPVVRYVLLCALLTAAFALTLRWIMRRCFVAHDITPDRSEPGFEAILMGLFIGLLVVGIRGGFQAEPLRWGNAVHTSSDFANQLSLNGLFALGHSAADRLYQRKTSSWQRNMPAGEAVAIARRLVVAPDEILLDKAERTVLRTTPSAKGNVTLRRGDRPPNVVLVIMESFSARFVGACGARDGHTPAFDKLAADGILFDHAFSGGTHTHQGVFCSTLGFPNLPGYEYLMENMVSNQPFLGLPTILKENGYSTIFLYNGNLAWDNMYGFFRKQGIDRFVAADDYVNPVRRDRVWGVTDQDVFDRANDEFESLYQNGPFFGLILTLSNHVPFDFPDPVKFERVTDKGEMSNRLNGIRYADWAAGRFIDEARKRTYFQNTLFVFVGDHGFHVPPTLTETHILYHHVPLLFYSPLFEQRGRIVSACAGQVNIVPSILGLLGLGTAHASWGRDLFSTRFSDENFAVFKGSGGSGTSQAVAMTRGDKLLVVNSDGSTRLWRYELMPDAAIHPLDDPASQELLKRMQQELFGYVQAATTDLVNQRAGPSADRSSFSHRD